MKNERKIKGKSKRVGKSRKESKIVERVEKSRPPLAVKESKKSRPLVKRVGLKYHLPESASIAVMQKEKSDEIIYGIFAYF